MLKASSNELAIRDDLTSSYWSDDVLRMRNVSATVLTDKLDVPPPPTWLLADWQRETSSDLELEAGDVEPLTLSRTRARWQGYRICVQLVSNWMQTRGLSDAFLNADVALMVCLGARYHHDATQYGSKAFCNLFLSEDKGLDLHFPNAGYRIPLTRGTLVLFDTGQPHGVVKRGTSRFDVADFSQEHDATQVFLSWELPIEDADLRRVLGIHVSDVSNALQPPYEEQVMNDGAVATVCTDSGRWLKTG